MKIVECKHAAIYDCPAVMVARGGRSTSGVEDARDARSELGADRSAFLNNFPRIFRYNHERWTVVFRRAFAFGGRPGGFDDFLPINNSFERMLAKIDSRESIVEKLRFSSF